MIDEPFAHFRERLMADRAAVGGGDTGYQAFDDEYEGPDDGNDDGPRGADGGGGPAPDNPPVTFPSSGRRAILRDVVIEPFRGRTEF